MEAWGIWLVAIGVAVAGAAAAFAWVQAHSAVESLKDARRARDEARKSAEESARLAGEANAAFVRQAEAQEEANRIKREEMTPDDWSISFVSGQLFKGTNTSGQLIHVEGFEVEPDGAAKLVSVRTNHQDGRYEYGDSFQFIAQRTMGGSAEKLIVRYRYDSDPADDTRRFIVPL